MKVKLIKSTRGGNGMYKAGTIIEVSESEAALLEKAGYIEKKPDEKKPRRR